MGRVSHLNVDDLEGEKGPIRSPSVPWLACLAGLEG